MIIWGVNPGIMHFLFRLILFFYVWGIFTAQGQKAEETTEEVKIEVLHRPENCSKTSKKGDLELDGTRLSHPNSKQHFINCIILYKLHNPTRI